MIPTRRPGGSMACTHGTWISALMAPGTRTWAASSAWNSDRKPQLVVIASAPSRTNWRRRPGSRQQPRQTRGVAPRTTRHSTGNGQVPALPISPGMRGNFASSIRIPSGAP